MTGFMKIEAMDPEDVRALADQWNGKGVGLSMEVRLRRVSDDDKVHLLLAVARAVHASAADMIRLLAYFADRDNSLHDEMTVGAEIPT